MTMPFKMYTFTIEEVRLIAPKPALSNIEVSAVIVKIIGISSKNMKPAKTLLLKLC